ncbi:MAG: flavodoxin domain-containing protein [Methanospirillum sp.]
MATILVAYASKNGATAEIAGWIGDALRRTGATVDVRAANDVLTLEGFDAVVVGGPIYMGRVLKPVPSFFSRNRSALAAKPVALFLSGTSLGKGDPEADRKGRLLADAVAEGVPVAALGLFGGRFSIGGMPLIGRFLKDEEKEKDTRDRPAIEAWADGLPTRLGL